MKKRIQLPLQGRKVLENFIAGDEILLSGVIYTARDAAHKKMFEAGKAPIDLRDKFIYYTGPTPTPPQAIVGSCGPTTSSRMDNFVEFMLADLQTVGMIGKGKRSALVADACKKYKAVYFIAPGGCGALLANSVTKIELVAYPEFLSEAIYRMEVEDMPLIVGIDIFGSDVFR
ncbi:MAG: TRZ/ATZ family protein [bacterium]|nr:TRZ/ATZ family protein [bacterium]